MPASAARDDGVGILRGQHTFFVRVCHRALVNRQESRADLHAFRAQRKCCCHAAAIGNAAGRNHGDGHRVAHGRHQRHGGKLAYVPAAFGAFRNHGVGAKALHAARQGGGGNHGDYLDASFFPHVHVVCRATRTGGNHVDFQVDKQLCQFSCVRIHEHNVSAKRLVGDLARRAHLLLHPFKGCATTGNDAQAARCAHRARQAGVGDARHGTLDNGHVNAQQFRDTCIHVAGFPILPLREITPKRRRVSYRKMVEQRANDASYNRIVSRYLRVTDHKCGALTWGNAISFYSPVQQSGAAIEHVGREPKIKTAGAGVGCFQHHVHTLP